MRSVWLVLVGSFAIGQTPPVPKAPAAPQPNTSWRSELMGLSDHPNTANPQDVDRFVQNVQLATPYFATITPGDFEANREMVRRMWAYTMGLEMMAGKNPALRPAASRARNAMNAFPIGYGMIQGGQTLGPGFQANAPAPQPALQQKPGAPPFATSAPAVAGMPEDLASRYASTAARGATAWQNAETLKQSLASRGMSLNAATAASLARLQVALESASRSMQARKWDDANESLDRADGEIEKITKVVGH